MLYNVTFDTYRWATVDEKDAYSASKTINSGAGFFAPAQAETKAVLNIDSAVKVYELLTEETNFDEQDKVTIDSVDYFIEDFENINANGVQLMRIVLLLKSNG